VTLLKLNGDKPARKTLDQAGCSPRSSSQVHIRPGGVRNTYGSKNSQTGTAGLDFRREMGDLLRK